MTETAGCDGPPAAGAEGGPAGPSAALTEAALTEAPGGFGAELLDAREETIEGIGAGMEAGLVAVVGALDDAGFGSVPVFDGEPFPGLVVPPATAGAEVGNRHRQMAAISTRRARSNRGGRLARADSNATDPSAQKWCRQPKSDRHAPTPRIEGGRAERR